MKRRKYPFSFFLLGILQNLISHFFLLIPILILYIIGAFGISACTVIANVLMACYFAYAAILQISIRNTSIRESDNPEFNEIMDAFLGRAESEDDTNECKGGTAMNPEQVWNKIISKLSEGPMELPTAPKINKAPVWFTASTDGDTIFINEAKEHRPSSKLSMERKLTYRVFERVYPYYLKRERGESVSKEVTAITVDQVYYFSVMKWLGE